MKFRTVRERNVGCGVLLVWLAMGGVAHAGERAPRPATAAAARPTGTPSGQTLGPNLAPWFARLRTGMWVKVETKSPGASGWRADEIKLLHGDLDESEIESRVESVDSTSGRLRTSFGTEVVANAKTEVRGPERERSRFATIRPGDRIEAEGQFQKDGALSADEIRVRRPHARSEGEAPKDKHEITARIESLDAGAHRIVVLGIPLSIDEQTRDKTPRFE